MAVWVGIDVLLASGGDSWTVIRVDDCIEFLSALAHASIESDLRPFATFIAGHVSRI